MPEPAGSPTPFNVFHLTSEFLLQPISIPLSCVLVTVLPVMCTSVDQATLIPSTETSSKTESDTHMLRECPSFIPEFVFMSIGLVAVLALIFEIWTSVQSTQ